MQGAINLFEKLYEHRLVNNWLSDDYYTIFDLIRDDPDVKAQFRQYTVEGKLVTPMTGDQLAYQQHTLAVVDALSVELDFQVDSAAIVDWGLESTNLQSLMNNSSGSGDPPPPPPPVMPPFKHVLECAIRQSMIVSCIRDAYLSGTGRNLDCIDFARMMAAWLHKRFGEMNVDPNSRFKYWLLRVVWYCPKRDANGNLVLDENGKVIMEDHEHFLSVVVVPGSPGPPPEPDQIWVIDAQTGLICGPYSVDLNESELMKRILACIAVSENQEGYKTCPNEPTRRWDPPKKFKPDDESIPFDDTWYRDRDMAPNHPDINNPAKNMWKRVSDRITECCNTFNATPCTYSVPPFNNIPGGASPCPMPTDFIWVNGSP